MAKTIERMAETMNFRILHLENPPRRGPVIVSGCAVREEMPPCLVNRPGGTGDRLLMLFYSPVRLRLGSTESMTRGPVLKLWREGAGHWYGNPGETWLHSWIHFHGSEISPLLASAGLEEEFRLEWHDFRLFESYLALVYREITGEFPPDARLLHNHLGSLFLEIARRTGGGTERRIPEPWLELRRSIVSTPERQWDLETLAARMNLSKPAFAARFRKYFGTAPIRCLIDARIELARHLLRDSSLSIKEIGARCGYPDPLQFSRMFRRRAGLPPGACRKSPPGGDIQ